MIVPSAPPAEKSRAGLIALIAGNNLALRIVSSLVLAPLALFAAYWGGWIFLAFWTIAALVVLWEWDTLVCTHDRNAVVTIGAVALVGASFLIGFGWPGIGVALIALAVLGVEGLASRVRRGWCAAGVIYSAVLLVAPVLLRQDTGYGLAAIVLLFVVVWATDIAAYFAGRALGGPKLAPSVSPNKTWSGAVGGTVAGIAGGVLVARYFGIGNLAAIAVVSLVISVAAQAGDLLESGIKRQFSAKDSGQIIPGHGGFMDRLDGFLTGALAALLIGLAHGGIDSPARGLMVW